MLKPTLQLAAVGLLGIALWKVALPFLLPFFLMIVKVTLLVGVLLFLVWWFRKGGDERKDGEAPGS